jgi:hypothetical protein
MESIRTSKRTIISRENGKYFLSSYNQYTNSTRTYDMIWDENGECRIEGEGFFKKELLDVSFQTSKIFENEKK